MNNKRIRKRSIGTLVVLLFVLNFAFTPALLFSNYNFGSGFKNPTDEEQNLNLSTNYLFAGTTYTFNLDDFYDDANLYKVYTGAKFQTEAFNGTSLEWSGVVNNDTVTPVDNTETQYGTPSGVYNGTYSFEGDADGSIPSGWSKTGTGTVEVQTEKEGHEKVVYILSGAPATAVYLFQVFTAGGQVFGTIEFWWYPTNEEAGWNNQFQIYSSSIIIGYLYVMGAGGDCIWYDFTGTTSIINDIANQWNHFKIYFNGSDVDISVNEESAVSVNFRAGYDTPSKIQLQCYDQADAYFDAVSFKTGTYLATYGFDDQPIGTSGSDINGIYTTYAGIYAHIIEEEDGHSKVLNYSTSAGYRYSKVVFEYLTQVAGTIESWIKLNCSESHQWQFTNELNTYLGYININPTLIQIRYDGGVYVTKNMDTTVNWTHLKLQFDYSTYKISFWINGELILEDGLMFVQEGTYLKQSRLQINTLNEGVMFMDALGYSWDPNYNIGDNIEGWDKDYTIGENLYPDNINMINGSYDYTDNMKVNDDSSTNFTSVIPEFFYETPNQWDNFTFTKGTGKTIGEIETINADYSVIESESSLGDSDFTIIPDGDSTPLQWGPIPGGSHWEKIDENPDSNDGGSTILLEVATIDQIDVIDYTSGDVQGGSVYKIVVRYAYAGAGDAGFDAYIDINLGGWQGYKQVTRPGVAYTAQNLNWTGLSGDQDDVIGFQVRLKSYCSTPSGSNVFTAIWVQVYYTAIIVDLDVQVDMQVDNPECTLIEYFKYSHKTNVSATIDLDIWNWISETWYEIESIDNTATFDDDSFTLGSGSDYVNSSFGVRIRFQLNTGSNDFELQIDRLRLDYETSPRDLEMTITFLFSNYNEDLLAMTVQSWQNTNISQTINFSIWNFDTGAYVQISSSSDTSFTKKEYNTTSPTDFISPSGIVKLYWVGSNTTNNFELHIDYLFIQIYYKLDLVHSKSFDTNGIYRYRWAVLGSVYYTQWVLFEVVDPDPNFHAISESDNPTRWLLQGADISPVENFTDDIAPSGDWDLYDVSPDDFNKYIPELDNYLTDYITFYGSSYESPAQWGDFSFTKGAGNTVGELETNDADEAIVDAGGTYSGESLLGTIKPADSDILTGWDEGSAIPHWSKLDEAPGDMDGDGGYIREHEAGIYDKWNFNSLVIPGGEGVTKMIFWAYCREQFICTAKISVSTSLGLSGIWDSNTDGTFTWESFTHSDLDISQAELDAFWLRVAVINPLGTFWLDIETVYIEVYTSVKQYSVDYSITWDVDDPESMEEFYYDYRTTFALDCDLDIYNWDTTVWLELESNTDVNWHTSSYTLTNPYISGSDEIRVRFQSPLTATDFDMELDMIVLEYNSIYTISKKHNNTLPGYAYMQTNTTELILLNSSVYGTNYTLISGDYFQVDFQTSSDSQINIILLRDGVVNKTLTLSQSGNPNFNRHTVQIAVSVDVEFDQLKISSTFEDTDYVRIYDIKTYKYTLTGDSADFYVGSKNDYKLYLTPDLYNLRIYDPYDGEVKVNTNITISSGYNFHIYQPVKSILCRITLFSPEGDYLQFEDYHIKINRSLNEEYNQFNLVDTLFYADEETYIYIDVYDRFDALIDSFERTASSYIDLEIEVYSLQIKNLQTQKTTVDINTTHVYPLLSEESIYFILAKDYYQIGYYDTNEVYKQFLIYLDSNQAYELNRSKICFLAYVNQKGEHLYFDDYKTYINDSLIYENVFYREIGDDIGIEVKDIYGISIKNQTYTVVSGDNYIPVVLTQYSLKIMNQQEIFNHINITRDPNHYESNYYWSEWIAPNEIIKFNLFAGYYEINLTDNEGGSYSFYEYTLNGDDILLISSDNILSQVIYNIANVNTTIGNLITNVEINITNQNSAINNSIINIDINLSNVNSTLGTLLTNIELDITNVANNISTLYVFTNNSFINLNNDMNNSFIYMENNIISINQSISNLVVGVSNDIYLINGTISTMISQLETNLLLMNVSIDTALFGLNTTLNLIGSNITSNYILLNNSITLTNTNINDSRIAILNNLLLVNNTICDLVSQVYSSVYLINNSIFNAVLDLGISLSLINNSINGNLSIVLQQNDFLTELYQMTMFSDLLNWTNIGLNTSLLTSQIDVWEFINNYRNDSVQVLLRYNDLIENLTVSAQNTIDQYLPKEDVEYRLKSVATGEYLGEWEPLPENRSVDFGFYDEEVPDIPSFDNTSITIVLIILIFIGVISLTSYFVYKYNKRVQKLKRAYTMQHTIDKDLIKGAVRPRSSRMNKIK